MCWGLTTDIVIKGNFRLKEKEFNDTRKPWSRTEQFGSSFDTMRYLLRMKWYKLEFLCLANPYECVWKNYALRYCKKGRKFGVAILYCLTLQSDPPQRKRHRYFNRKGWQLSCFPLHVTARVSIFQFSFPVTSWTSRTCCLKKVTIRRICPRRKTAIELRKVENRPTWQGVIYRPRLSRRCEARAEVWGI